LFALNVDLQCFDIVTCTRNADDEVNLHRLDFVFFCQKKAEDIDCVERPVRAKNADVECPFKWDN
jgi:hypothetical protein